MGALEEAEEDDFEELGSWGALIDDLAVSSDSAFGDSPLLMIAGKSGESSDGASPFFEGSLIAQALLDKPQQLETEISTGKETRFGEQPLGIDLNNSDLKVNEPLTTAIAADGVEGLTGLLGSALSAAALALPIAIVLILAAQQPAGEPPNFVPGRSSLPNSEDSSPSPEPEPQTASDGAGAGQGSGGNKVPPPGPSQQDLNKKAGEISNAVGKSRERKVAELIGGTVNRDFKGNDIPVEVPGVGKARPDVIGNNGELVLVGGPNKADPKYRSKFGRDLSTFKKVAEAKGTPQSAIELANKWLGKNNVFIFPK